MRKVNFVDEFGGDKSSDNIIEDRKDYWGHFERGGRN